MDKVRVDGFDLSCFLGNFLLFGGGVLFWLFFVVMDELEFFV